MVLSPVTGKPEISLEYNIPVSEIINGWKNSSMKIDVTDILSSTDTVKVYKCLRTGYRFYYPFDIAGDGTFYEQLQENDWYYMPWKWEHNICADLISENDKVLEVGCGQGAFIKKISAKKKAYCVGLELNKSAVMKTDLFQIRNETVEEFQERHTEMFDLVCSFQVLEHISQVNSFIEAQINLLKPGGLLVIGVPNNNSFLNMGKLELLNLPPHHMGLWDEKSLLELGEWFSLKLRSVHFEPLQPHHFDYYFRLKAEKFFGKNLYTTLVRRLYKYGLKHMYRSYIAQRAESITGHTILTVFQKPTT